MLLYPAMNDLLAHVPSRYMLVNVIANRARKIAFESEQNGVSLTEKPVSMAVAEIAKGEVNLEVDEDLVEEEV